VAGATVVNMPVECPNKSGECATDDCDNNESPAWYGKKGNEYCNRGSFGSVEKMSRTLSVGLASSYRVLSERDRQPLGGTLALLSHRRLAVAMLK
jgi:hypothetical protein